MCLQLTNLKKRSTLVRNIGEPMYNDKMKLLVEEVFSQDITEQNKTKAVRL
jgi:hypothetical protein